MCSMSRIQVRQALQHNAALRGVVPQLLVATKAPDLGVRPQRSVREKLVHRFGLVSATRRTATVAGRSGKARVNAKATGCSGITLPALQPAVVAVLWVITAAAATPPSRPGSRQATTLAPSSAPTPKRIT